MRRLVAAGVAIGVLVTAVLWPRQGTEIARPSPAPTERPAVGAGVPAEAPLAPLLCATRIGPTDIVATAAKLSPDQTTVAIARDLNRVARLSTRRPDPELRRVQLLDRATGAITDLARGSVPFAWSTDGSRLAFHESATSGLQARTDVVVYDVRARREIARLHGEPGAAPIPWQGDTLLYQVGPTLHAWTGSTDRVVATFDGAATLALSEDGAAVAAAYGQTRIDRLVVMDLGTSHRDELLDVWGYDWSPTGHRMLVSYLDRSELRDEDGRVATYDHPVHNAAWQWARDGRRPLFHEPPTVIHDVDTVDPLIAFVTIERAPARVALPISAHGVIAADGMLVGIYADGWSASTFAMYRCDDSAPAYDERPRTQTLYYPETTERWAAAPDGRLPARWREWLESDLADAGIHALSANVVRPIPRAPAATCAPEGACVNGFVLAVTIPYAERERAFARCFALGDGATYVPSWPLHTPASSTCLAL